MKIVLIGNPNVGKSVIFTRLTGTYVISSNYPGTTVGYTTGAITHGGQEAAVIDTPGIYTLQPLSKVEEVTAALIQEADIVVNVVDATNLERNLSLTFELLETGKPMAVLLNFWDECKHKGVCLDTGILQQQLQVPVIPTVAVTGEGVSQLFATLFSTFTPPRVPPSDPQQRWDKIRDVITQVQVLKHHHHSALEVMEELSVHPVSGVPIALAVILGVLKLVTWIGEGLTTYIFDPLFYKLYAPVIVRLDQLLSQQHFWHDVLIGKFTSGSMDFKNMFGILTAGLYIPIALILPFVFAFYLCLSLLEDLGYLPRMAVLADSFMHRLGLHGYAVVSFFMGLGCNVPGILATSLLESRRQRFIAATLLSLAIPCAALQAMIIGTLTPYGIAYPLLVFGILLAVLVVLGLLMQRWVKGFSPELLLEIPPYRMPRLKIVLYKSWIRLAHFLTEAIPYIFIGLLIVNILNSLHLMRYLADFTAPLMLYVWGLPKDAIAALLIGSLRKEIGIGMLIPMHLSLAQMITAITVLSMYFPCIPSFIVLLKEFGVKDTMKILGIMVLASIIVGWLVKLGLALGQVT